MLEHSARTSRVRPLDESYIRVEAGSRCRSGGLLSPSTAGGEGAPSFGGKEGVSGTIKQSCLALHRDEQEQRAGQKRQERCRRVHAV